MPNSTFQTAVLALSPLGYWPLNDSAANAVLADISGNGLSTTTTAGSTHICQVAGLIPTSSDTATRPAGGTTSKNRKVSGANFNYSGVSVMCWVNTTTATPTPQDMFMALTGASAAQLLIVFFLNSGIPTFRIWTADSVQHDVAWPSSVADGKSHFLVGTWDGSTMFMYVDGVQSAGVAMSSAKRTGVFDIGLCGPIDLLSGNSVTGTQDDTAVFLTALTAAQVLNLYTLATTT